jgi:hypothetical protein
VAPAGQAQRGEGLVALRVLHCPDVVGGNPPGLAAAERELGIDSRTLVLRASPYGYPSDEIVWNDGDGAFVRERKRWSLLPRMLRDFDVVHFNAGSTIAPERVALDSLDPERAARARTRIWAAYAAAFEQLDLRLLARAGKAIFVTFQGSDARPGRTSAAADEIKRRRIARFERHADGIYALNPDLLHVLPAPARFVPYTNVDPREWQSPPAEGAELPLVVHAPTDREIKGTQFVLDAVARLQAEGVPFRFELVEGLTHVEARALYGRADLLVDQLLVGWYGGLAVELMALGRPVVAYLRDEDLDVLPPAMRAELPVVSAQPATIYDVLKDLLTTRRGELAEIGRRGRVYVERWHDPRRIAGEIVADYRAAVERRRSRGPSRSRRRSSRSSGSG